MSTYPQDLSTEKRRTSGLSTRKNDSIRASSFPPRKKSVPGFPSVHTHERKQKNKTKKQNKTKNKKDKTTKTKRQNNKTKINNKNRKQNKKMIMSKNN